MSLCSWDIFAFVLYRFMLPGLLSWVHCRPLIRPKKDCCPPRRNFHRVRLGIGSLPYKFGCGYCQVFSPPQFVVLLPYNTILGLARYSVKNVNYPKVIPC
ncbi:hypothetical protein DFP73DRAFT_237279 [Morchella snyderi]|nr:hypothetical protein DFP73DRAFT_237279 [Morchella snyderi]